MRLQLARYRFHWQINTPLQLPPYASSTLRGVFGRALRHLACLTQASECRGCAMLAACPYPQLFEPQTVPRPSGGPGKGQPALAPYAIETSFPSGSQCPPENHRYYPGEHFTFDMVLMTPAAITRLSLIIAAWKQAFAKGVGKGDGTAALIRVEHLLADGAPYAVYSAQKPQLQHHKAELSVPKFTSTEDVQLHLQTPLRIEQQGKLIKEQDMTASLFLRHLIRRVSFQIGAQQADAFSLAEIHQFNALADQAQEGERQLQWCDWSRYSSRQKQKMTLGGLLGQLHLQQVPPQLLPFIYLGQWLHVGKESTFGLGKYQWSSSPSLLGAA